MTYQLAKIRIEIYTNPFATNYYEEIAKRIKGELPSDLLNLPII